MNKIKGYLMCLVVCTKFNCIRYPDESINLPSRCNMFIFLLQFPTKIVSFYEIQEQLQNGIVRASSLSKFYFYCFPKNISISGSSEHVSRTSQEYP